MDFNQILQDALVANSGSLSFEQAVALVPPASQHLIMHKLSAARQDGVCDMIVKVVDGKGVITIVPPKTSQPVGGAE